MKRFLYELQTGQSGTQLTRQHMDYELGSRTCGRSGGGSGFNKGRSGHRGEDRHESKVIATAKDVETQSEGSETGILRVVDVSVEVHQASADQGRCSQSEQFGHDPLS